MALSGQFMRRILGGGSIVSLSIQSRNSLTRLESTLSSPRLFISGLSESTTDEKLKEAFAPFGNLVEAEVIVEKTYGISTGFGVVTYNTVEEAKKARGVMDNNILEDCTILVEPRGEPCQQEQAPSRNKTGNIGSSHYHTEAGEEYINKGEVEKQIIRKGDIIRDDAVANQPSLKTLLASPQRNYVISSQGDEVPFGASILLHYNIAAYPFTCKKALELETENIKELKLEMLWDKNTVFRRNTGRQVSFSELSGKRVMLVFERLGVEHDFDQNSPITMFLLMLNGRYLHTVGTDDEFEVIRIVIDNTESSSCEQLDLEDKCCLASLLTDLEHVHWIVTLASQLKRNLVSSKFWYGRSIDEFKYYFPILAFDRDGRLVRKTIYPTFETLEFPFCASSLEEEILSQLTTLPSH